MQEWKIRQTYFDMITSVNEYKDDLNLVDIVTIEHDEIVPAALKHFNEHVDEWIYPAKSYVVAICYAKWISEDFGDNFYETLNDPLLLAGNDPYFVPYEADQDTYDEIINIIMPLQMKGMVPDIYEYYKEEILNVEL